MRMCKDLDEASPMQEITQELQALSAAMREIVGHYENAASMDPDYVKLNAYREKALHYMRLKAAFK